MDRLEVICLQKEQTAPTYTAEHEISTWELLGTAQSVTTLVNSGQAMQVVGRKIDHHDKALRNITTHTSQLSRRQEAFATHGEPSDTGAPA